MTADRTSAHGMRPGFNPRRNWIRCAAASDRCSKINSFPEMQSCAANVTVHREKALDPVVAGISTLGPIISWLFRDKRKLCNSLHILQAELYRNKQAEGCAVVYG
jgi:hypothetical protein